MTKMFLEGKVRSVLLDFQSEKWCSLNKNNLSSSSYMLMPNQQHYILKYYGAYFCELYGAYEKFLNNFDGNSLKVLSIGCGSGVDCEALNRVMIDKDLSVRLEYIGVDIVDWQYRPDFSWASFRTCCVSKLTHSDIDDIDLFVFPKSLTEISHDFREGIANIIAGHSRKRNICFLNTYVTDDAEDGSRVDGISQFGAISKTLEANGWECIDKPSQYQYIVNGGWLGHRYGFFKVPDELIPYVSDLKSNCGDRDTSDRCDSCKIDFYPVMKSRYLAYALLRFKRTS